MLIVCYFKKQNLNRYFLFVLYKFFLILFISEENVLDNEVQSHVQLDAILGNMKPLINILQDEMNTFHNIGIVI